MEAEMKAAAKQLEFERAAALRDEIQQIRLRVLEQDASVTVGRAAERAARDAASTGLTGAADRNRGRRSRSRASRSSRPTRNRQARPTAYRASTRARPPTGCRVSATNTRTTAAGRRAGWTARPGTAR
jgi:hypothetical protein